MTKGARKKLDEIYWNLYEKIEGALMCLDESRDWSSKLPKSKEKEDIEALTIQAKVCVDQILDIIEKMRQGGLK